MKLLTILVVLLSIFAGCGKKDITDNPTFTGKVIKVDVGEILVGTHDLLNGYHYVYVPTRAVSKDSMKSFSEGDEIRVYFDGTLSGSVTRTEVEKVLMILSEE